MGSQIKYSDEKIIQVLKDIKEHDLTADEAAKKHGVTKASIYTWGRRAGIEIRKEYKTNYNWDHIIKQLEEPTK